MSEGIETDLTLSPLKKEFQSYNCILHIIILYIAKLVEDRKIFLNKYGLKFTFRILLVLFNFHKRRKK